MKRIFCIALTAVFAVLMLCGCSSEKEYPDPTDDFFVNDFADVISAQNRAEIQSKAAALNQKTTAQVVTVTVESLGGKEPYEYATELGRKWGVGDKEKNNGVVILLSEGDREIYIAVGYGLEGALPDSKTGRIIDTYGLEYLRKNDFSSGLLSIANAVINEVYIEYGITPENGYTPIDNIPQGANAFVGENGEDTAISWVIMIVIIAVIVLFSRRRGSFIWFGPSFYTGGHRGHGGFGGGFGGFSGGGGSFGGGGAGRGF